MTQPRLLLAVTAALLVFASPAAAGIPQTGNDSFGSATDLQGGLSNFLDIDNETPAATGETGEPNHEGITWPQSCTNSTTPDTSCNPSIWYRWTPESSGVAQFAVDCAYDFTSAVYTGSAVNALTEVIHPAFACGWTMNAAAGQEYKIVFSGRGDLDADRTGTMEGSIVLRPKPGNDDFPGTTLSGSSGTFAGSNEDATGQSGEPDHAGGPSDPVSLEELCDGPVEPHHGCIRSLWYTWTAPAGGPATFDTCDSDYDTTLAVYTGNSVGGLAEVASNDDADTGACGPLDVDVDNYRGSRVEFDAVAGTTYRIAVAGYQADVIYSSEFPTIGEVGGNFSGPSAPPTPVVTPPSVVTPGPAPDAFFAGAAFAGSRTINVSGGRFAIRLRSPEDANASIAANSVQAFAVQRRRKRRVRVGSARAALVANQTKTVRIRVSRKAMRVLRGRGRLRTAITVTGTDKAGNRKVTKRTVTLKLKRKPRRRSGRSVAGVRR